MTTRVRSVQRVTMKSLEGKIGFIGAGNMAQPIANGLIESDFVKPSQIYVSAPSTKNFDWWKNAGINTTNDNCEVLSVCHTILLAMKPQFLGAAILSLQKYNKQSELERLFISILAGVTINQLTEKLGTVRSLGPCDVIRVIPNTPIMVGAGCTAMACHQSVKPVNKMIAKAMFSTLGSVCEEVPENLMNPIGALSGSGPAFVYIMIDALSAGAVKMGVPKALALKLAAQTFLGAAKLVQETGKHPEQLKDEVCSPGGSTITGVYQMEKAGVRAALMDAIEACTKRSEELGRQN